MKRVHWIQSVGALLAVAVVGAVVAVAVAADDAKQPLAVGDKAPGFNAEDAEGNAVTLDTFKDKKVVVQIFSCNSCPVIVAYEDRFIAFQEEYADKGVQVVAINVNGGERESHEAMQQRAEAKGFNFPYVRDDSQESGKAYGARVTPHIYVLDEDRNVRYIGAFDDNMNAEKVKVHYVADAVDALLAGEEVKTTESRAVGCGIAYKK